MAFCGKGNCLIGQLFSSTYDEPNQPSRSAPSPTLTVSLADELDTQVLRAEAGRENV
jgi:hypothetical protein